MKKTIILSETDLKNIIKKVLNKKTYIFEQSSEGCIKGDCQNGEGTFVDGDRKYVGTFKNGNREGKGILYYNNVKYYEGDWKNDMWEGKGKEYDTETKKLRYVGQFKGDRYEGQGTYYYRDGAKYVGQWKEGTINGQGTYYYNKGGKYVGQWKESSANGQGTLYYRDGAKYVGQWKEGTINGQGTYTNPHLVSFSGKWKDSKLDGKDTEYYDKQLTNSTFLNTSLTGEGCIKGNCSNGWGVQVLPDGNGKYSGNFKNGEYNGTGTYTNKYGVSFKGNWVDGYLDGYGVDNLMFIKSKKEYDCKSYLEKKRQNEKFYYYSKKEDVKKFKEEHTGAQFVEDSPYKCEADGKTYYFVKVQKTKTIVPPPPPPPKNDDENTNNEDNKDNNQTVTPETCPQPTVATYRYKNDKMYEYAKSENCWWAQNINTKKWFNLTELVKTHPNFQVSIDRLNVPDDLTEI